VRAEDTWRVVAGAVALLVVAGLLLSTPSMIFVRKVQIVDTELRDTGQPRTVLSRFDLGDPKDLATVPKRMGPWNETREYQEDRIASLLGTNVLLSRDYGRDDVFQPVNLLIIQSGNVSSFHPAAVCYRAQGYDVPPDEGRVVNVNVPNVTWAQQQWLSKDEQNVFDGNLSARLLQVSKAAPNGSVLDKRVALYVYLKREDWRVTDQVTWIRLEMAVGANTTADEALPILSDLMREAVPSLFVFKVTEERTLGESLIDRFGVAGAGIVAAAVAVPCWPIAAAIRHSVRGPKP
jgi:hypothetical protein